MSSSKPFRKRAAGMFDADVYKKRGMVEGIFGRVGRGSPVAV